ncbi:vacuolar protein sorting-associated protein 26-domain-containing protein [Lactarius vividus]|nr:vacuolar protein sorting-associated protein 26-domain-containing protein [Lactarius vividus]
MAAFSASPIDIDIKLEGEELKQIDFKVEKDHPILCPVYYDGESISGQVTVRVREGKRTTRDGIEVEFVGNIELFHSRSHYQEFLSFSPEVSAPGDLRQAQTFDFMFKNVEKQYGSYLGISVKLRNNSTKMEVGIEDCHTEFEYNKLKYHLKDVIVGKNCFLLVRIKIKHVEPSIIRRETTGLPPNQYNESSTITKFEIMDCTPRYLLPRRNNPIRLFLGGFDLTPTFRDVNTLLQAAKLATGVLVLLVIIDCIFRWFELHENVLVMRDTPGVTGVGYTGLGLRSDLDLPIYHHGAQKTSQHVRNVRRTSDEERTA